MIRFIVLAVLISVTAAKLDVFSEEWYPLRLFAETEDKSRDTRGRCEPFKFHKQPKKDSCKCNGVKMPTIKVSVDDKVFDALKYPAIVLEEGESASEALDVTCDSPATHNSFFVFEPINDNHVLVHFSPYKTEYRILFGKAVLSEKDLDELVDSKDVLKNQKAHTNICTTESLFQNDVKKRTPATNTNDSKKTLFNFDRN